MKAQILYDWREREELVSGSDLHDFFAQQIGDPSPSGRVEIESAKAEAWALATCAVYGATFVGF